MMVARTKTSREKNGAPTSSCLSKKGVGHFLPRKYYDGGTTGKYRVLVGFCWIRKRIESRWFSKVIRKK